MIKVKTQFSSLHLCSEMTDKIKKFAWTTWSAYREVSTMLRNMAENPYDKVSLTSSIFLMLFERFIILLYDKSSTNEARLDLFCKKNIWGTCCLLPKYVNVS